MQIKAELISREIAGEYFLVPVGKSVLDTNGLFALNELGFFLWELLPAVETEDDLVKKVLEEYEVEEDVARRDIRRFLDKLRGLGVL